MSEIQTLLKELREYHGYTYRTIGEALGVHPVTVQHWAGGTQSPVWSQIILRALRQLRKTDLIPT